MRGIVIFLAIAISIFLITLVLVIWQPKSLSIGWSALGGAAIALLAHVVSIGDVFTVTRIVGDATLAFVAIVIFSIILDQIGFFEWAALKMAFAAKGDGRKVFFYVVTLGALVSAIFTNDGAALILTPIVLEKIKLLKFNNRKMIPFIMACGFIADTTSIPFVTSNLVNIVSADYFHVRFLSYAIHMIVPDLFSFIASVIMLYLVFRKDIPKYYHPSDLPNPQSVIKHMGMFKLSWGLLGMMFIGYLGTEIFRIPVSFVAGFIAILFLLASAKTKVSHPAQVIKEAPWAIVFFSVGMYVVVYGLRNAGLTNLLGLILERGVNTGLYGATITVGFVAAFLSSVMNNLPSVMIDALAIQSLHTSVVTREALVYANVIGCDLGPKITPIGSLATLLWLHVLGKKGIKITWGQYFRTGIVLTIPVLFITLSSLYVWIRFIG